jgi:hypothetical protein
MAPVRLQGVDFNVDSVVYVVDNSPGNDINCDIILGKQTIATSKYPLLDMKREVLMSDRASQHEIKCQVAAYKHLADGTKILVPKELLPLSTTELASVTVKDEKQMTMLRLATGFDPGDKQRLRRA